MKTILKTQTCLNPFFMEGKQINTIYFYKDGKVLASSKWLSNSNNNYKSLEFDFEVKRATRPNLGRKDAFYMNTKNESVWGKEYDLYIYADLVGLQDLGIVPNGKSWYYTSTRHDFSVNLRGERWKIEKVEPSKESNWNNFKHTPVMGEYVEKFSCGFSFVDTEEATRCKEIAEELKKITKKDISFHDVHDILNIYDLKRK